MNTIPILSEGPTRSLPTVSQGPATTRATCPYCGTGCGVLIDSVDGQITDVRGDPDHPANFGRLCTKGSTLHLTAASHVTQQTRLLHPMRRPHRAAAPVRVNWEAALDEAANRLADIVQRHGPDAVGFYGSGQLLTEDYYVLNKLVKGLLGTNHLDTNSRLCMSSAVAGYKATLGSDAPPACYEDFDHAQTLFIAGANTAWAHPILFRRIEAARATRPGMKLIVVDPRRTETAEMADLHLAIQPGTDVALFHGMLHVMARDGLIDTDFIALHTQGFEELMAIVRQQPPSHAADMCGISEHDLVQAAHWFGGHTPTLSLYCQGLNQSSHGTDKNAALIHLHLATGQIGRAGAGPFSLTGQPNAMGGREVGGMANLLSAHRSLASQADRAEVAALWGLHEVPARPGRTAVEMFEAAARGEVKALWIACTNPAQSLPDQATVRAALARAELVVVQEAFASTATCAYADLLLPASTWGEKEGTVTNSERRISRVRGAVPPAGEARADWAIFADLGRRLEQRLPQCTARYLPETRTLFPYSSAESVWNEHRESTRGRDLDITGLSYRLLDEIGPQQWPMPEGSPRGQARLYTDGRFATPDGRARFVPMAPQPVHEACDAAYPFALNTGRLRDQWHGMSRTGTLGRLLGHVPEPVLDMHPSDMAAHGLHDGDLVEVRSRRGMLRAPVQASEGVGPGQAHMAMHWGEEALSGRDADGMRLAGVNALTQPAFCPSSKQPELKHAAVAIAACPLPWRFVAVAWLPAEQALATREALKPWMGTFDFSSCTPFGREPDSRVGLVFRAAHRQAPELAMLQALAKLFGLGADQVLRYDDPAQHQHRWLQLETHGQGLRIRALLLAGGVASERWLRPLLQEGSPVETHLGRLLDPSAMAPLASAPRSKQVCTCFNVNEAAIVAQLSRCDGSPEVRLASLQSELKCGTNCGSCLPTLRKLVQATPLAMAGA